MPLRSTLVAVGLGLALVVATSAAAQNDVVPEQQPPSEQQPAVAPEPEPAKCVLNDSGFRQDGGKAMFVIALSNACETRQRCTVSAYVVTAEGPKQGRATLTLAPKSQGKAAQGR